MLPNDNYLPYDTGFGFLFSELFYLQQPYLIPESIKHILQYSLYAKFKMKTHFYDLSLDVSPKSHNRMQLCVELFRGGLI